MPRSRRQFHNRTQEQRLVIAAFSATQTQGIKAFTPQAITHPDHTLSANEPADRFLFTPDIARMIFASAMCIASRRAEHIRALIVTPAVCLAVIETNISLSEWCWQDSIRHALLKRMRIQTNHRVRRVSTRRSNDAIVASSPQQPAELIAALKDLAIFSYISPAAPWLTPAVSDSLPHNPRPTMRSYTSAHALLASSLRALDLPTQTSTTPEALLARMRCVVHALWSSFGKADGSPRDGLLSISWVGFYKKEPADEMTLVCREPKPACSPIGLQGMCGKGWRDAAGFVVPDVKVLGPNYIACDPRDTSELVLPVILPDNTCWGVLDVDAYEQSAFTEADAYEMQTMLRAARLLDRDVPIVTIR